MVKFLPLRDNEADVSSVSVSRSPEWIEKLLWVVCVYTRHGEAIPLVETWSFEHLYKLVEQEAFVDYVRVKSAKLKDELLLEGFAAFCVSLVLGKTTDCHVVGTVVWEVEMASNSFSSTEQKTLTKLIQD